MEGRAIFTEDSMKEGKKEVSADTARTTFFDMSGGEATAVIMGNTLSK
jgi:hypothetical protein